METSAPQPSSEKLKTLGNFLRSKRNATSPAERGIVSSRRRLNPGLSREETAALADIGASWYARLEAGHISHPTVATMRAVARALQFTPVEREFAFRLAGVIEPGVEPAAAPSTGNAIVEMLTGTGIVAMILYDRFLAPVGWNATADGMLGFSTYATIVERNPVVHLENPMIIHFFGADFESWSRDIVGVFRRAYSTEDRTPYAQAVLDLAMTSPTFRKHWDAHHVADESALVSETIVRHHPLAGSFNAVPVNLSVPDLRGILRILAPADDDARAKFEQMRALGRPFVPETDLH